MKKLSGIFAVSMIAIMTAGAARADIASSKYVDDQVALRVATDQGVANAGKTMVVNAEGKVAPGTVSYDDLDNKPTIPAAQVNSDWNSTSGVSQILNKPTLGDLAAKSTISNADVADDAAIDQSKISGLTTDLAGKQATLGATNVTTTGKGNVVTAVTAADGTVTVSKTLTLGDLATAAPGSCSNTTNKCVLVFDGTAYSWEVVKR